MGKRKAPSGRRKAAPAAIRVNLGGTRYKDAAGHVWEQDRQYHAGGWGCTNAPETDVLDTTDPIAGTDDQPLVQSIRVGEQVHYRFDVPNGTYRVRILFAEIYWETHDAERQDVYVAGKKVLSDYSMFDEVGHDACAEKVFTARATGSKLEVRLQGLSFPMHSGARACAIEVTPAGKTRP